MAAIEQERVNAVIALDVYLSVIQSICVALVTPSDGDPLTIHLAMAIDQLALNARMRVTAMAQWEAAEEAAAARECHESVIH